MRRVYKFAVMVAAILINVSLISCSKEKEKPSVPDAKSLSIKTSDYKTWTYFSFEKGIIGTYGETEFDYKNRLDWDLAFHRWDVRTNGGESGKGQGGAVLTAYGNLNTGTWSSHIPSYKFITDTKIKTYMAPPNMNAEDGADQRKEVPGSTELAKWMTVTMSSIPPTYKVNEKAFVVKTASGKFAALRFTGYMNDKAEKGYASFEYIYPLN